MQEETIDLRRGLDLLLQRTDIDPKRVAFVGHSLGTVAGSVLDAIDKRFETFVFMAGPQSVREVVLTSHRRRIRCVAEADTPFEDRRVSHYLCLG